MTRNKRDSSRTDARHAGGWRVMYRRLVHFTPVVRTLVFENSIAIVIFVRVLLMYLRRASSTIQLAVVMRVRWKEDCGFFSLIDFAKSFRYINFSSC